MKRVLITGANSYIGTSLEKWLAQWPDQYQVETVDMIGNSWREKDFSCFDTVFHVAGIAHVSSDPKLKDLYFRVNRDLTVEAAKKAKLDGVKQFIFMSSIIIYGGSDSLYEKKIITRNSIPMPADFYGQSKLEAEQAILCLQDNNYRIAILRPPMVYGKDSKGNYQRLAKFAIRFSIFPNIDNERSMLYIDNLCEFVRLLIDSSLGGIYFPQNSEYVKTSKMVQLIACANGRHIRLVKIFNPILKFASRWLDIINKVFGSQVYDLQISNDFHNYRILNFEESIIATEKGRIRKQL